MLAWKSRSLLWHSLQSKGLASMLVVVVVAVVALTCGSVNAVPSSSVEPITFLIEMNRAVTVTLLQPPENIGKEYSIVVPAGEKRTLPIEPAAPLLREGINLKVGNQVHYTAATLQGRVASESGAINFYITGKCALKQSGLQFVTTLFVTNGMETPNAIDCAAPVTN